MAGCSHHVKCLARKRRFLAEKIKAAKRKAKWQRKNERIIPNEKDKRSI